MRILAEHIDQLRELDMVVKMMKSEIQHMRHIIACYTATYGETVDSVNPPPPHISYGLMPTSPDKNRCSEYNFKALKITSNYEIILKKLEDLGFEK